MMYQCLTVDFDKVDKRIKSITKKLDKYGFNYVYKVHNVEIKEVPYYKVDPVNKNQRYKERDVLVEVQNYEFDMETLKLGNYLPVAIIEHNVVLDVDGATNIVHMVNNEEELKREWLTIKGHCDDCQDNYDRIKTVILKDVNSGEYKQVGTGCLRKYIGIDCFDIISIYGSIIELFDEELYLDDSNSYSKQNKQYCKTQKFLAACIDVIKSNNNEYRSKQFAEDSTVEQAKKKINSNEDIQSYNDAAMIIKFYKDLVVLDACKKLCVSLFDLDICNACISEYTTIDNGRLAYAYIAYKKLKDLVENSQDLVENSQYIGNVGEKLTVQVVCNNCIPIDTMYGLSHLYIFNTINGDELVWFTASFPDIEIGKQYNITGKVKEHRIYDDKKQTVLTRVKIGK